MQPNPVNHTERNRRRTTALIVILGFLAAEAISATITVTNSNASGAGSLAQAIADANAATPPVTILFNIPGTGVHTIRPTTAFPTITNQMIIDGYSQPGSHPNTLTQGDDAAIMIELDGSLLSNQNALFFDTTGGGIGGGNTVRGLAIFGFPGECLMFRLCDGNIVQGNFLGTDASGVNAPDNGGGIYFNTSFSNKVGGSNPAERNIISGAKGGIVGTGIEFYGAINPFNAPTSNTLVQGNYIGTDKSGLLNRGNKDFGIAVSSPMVTIGGINPGEGNIIAFNTDAFDVTSARAKEVYILGNSVFGNTYGFRFPNPGPATISAGASGGTTVSGTVSGSAGISQRIEIFANDECGANGIGQGKTFLGFVNAVPGAGGSAPFAVVVSPPLGAGQYLTATATPDDPDGRTMDYSLCYKVPTPAVLPSLTVARQNNQILLTWPSSATGFTLQSSDSLNGTWLGTDSQGVVIGDHFQATDSLDPTNRFYRLKK